MRRANNAKSKIRARVEHVFAEQKDRMGLFIRTIGIARATSPIMEHQVAPRQIKMPVKDNSDTEAEEIFSQRKAA